jgi:blue copper oxidase
MLQSVFLVNLYFSKNNLFMRIFLLLLFSSSLVHAQMNPLVIPPILSGNIINLDLQTGQANFFGTPLTNTMGVNGALLGPTILLERNQQVEINVTNNLGEPSTIHWHGLHVSPENDGGPHTVIMPGQTWSPAFTVLDWASTYWYHPHLHHFTNEHVLKGIAGFILVTDPDEQAIDLPRTYGVDDFPLAVQTKAFDAFNQIVIESALDTAVMVNGTMNAYLDVPAQVIRLRLLNGSSERYYNFGFSNNQQFFQIGSDGGLLEQSIGMTRLMLAPGERAEILLNLDNMVGQSIDLMSYASTLPNGIYGATQPGMGPGQVIPDYANNPLNGSNFNILRLNIQAPTANPVTSIPANLVSHTIWSETDADEQRTLTFNPVNQGPSAINGPFTINGQLFDMDVINKYIPFDNIEVWTLVNQTPISHPFHIHDVQFYILDINGVPPPPNLRGRKDVVHVPAGNGTVRFITQFDDFYSTETPYMYHCHMLTHEDDGMMGQFLVMPPCNYNIIDQPEDVNALSGGSAVFSVNILDPNATYAWQSDIGFGWQNLTDAGQYSGVTTSTLTVSNVSVSNNNQLFRCIIQSELCELTSESAVLLVDQLSVINQSIDNFQPIYPNPFSEGVFISNPTDKGVTINLLDASGRIILTKENIAPGNQYIDLKHLDTGTYFLQYINSPEILKIVKIK